MQTVIILVLYNKQRFYHRRFDFEKNIPTYYIIIDLCQFIEDTYVYSVNIYNIAMYQCPIFYNICIMYSIYTIYRPLYILCIIYVIDYYNPLATNRNLMRLV